MRHNPNVCISCVGDTHVLDGKFTIEYESAVVFGFGTADEVAESEKTQALRLLCLKHTPRNMNDFDNAIEKSLHRTAV